MMAVNVDARFDGVLAAGPSQYVMPVEVIMDPARRPPLGEAGDPGRIGIGELPVVNGARISAIGVAARKRGFVQERRRERVDPVEFPKNPVVGNFHAVNGARIGLKLVRVVIEPVGEQTVPITIEIVVATHVPLIGVVGRALREEAGAGRRQIRGQVGRSWVVAGREPFELGYR